MIEAQAVNHIGIAVRALDEHRDYYERVLGATYQGTEEVASQHVRVAFYRVGPAGAGVLLELLEPTAPESPIAKFLERRGEGLHHVAYTVENIEQRLRAAQLGGIQLIDMTSRTGAHQTRVAFLHPKSTGAVLTELVEPA
jgi:methylmalonyl-CoA/ethylmalonyl-CoA epimerase